MYHRTSVDLGALFRWTKSLVEVADPNLALIEFSICPEIRFELRGKARLRAFMHVGHKPGIICVHRSATSLSEQNVFGLFLHEFGHLATPGGTEQDADQWVFAKLGIVIEYRGPNELEWAKF